MNAADQAVLLDRWRALCARQKVNPSRETFDLLFSRYTAPERHYHDIRHIASSLAELDRVRGECDNCDAVEFAIWFHDCIYDVHRPDNEEQSARIARERLHQMGASDDLISDVVKLILATKHASPPQTPDEQLMVDIDLVPLGAPGDVFDGNDESIRREYAHMDDAAYARGRSQILTGFLKRPRIYSTDVFAEQYEQQARQNLFRWISQAHGQPDR